MIPLSMRAWQVDSPRPLDEQPLRYVERPVPTPASGELLVEVSTCGVCRTDLHVTEGDLDVHRPGITPGHEIVGRVLAVGEGVDSSRVGQRVGGAWLRATCGACRWCRRGRENLCPASRYTGWDDDGGYAEFTTIPDAFAYSLPEGLDDVEAAPLLCAGVIGYRALHRAKVPTGGRVGLYGFGASAHITMQVALAMGAECHVLTRGEQARSLALELGAASAGAAYDAPPTLLDSAIVFAPAGELVPHALEALDRGGTLALAGIHMSEIPTLDYQRHLFLERSMRSVTSNTRADAEELLALSARLSLRLATRTYPLDAADRALADLSAGRVTGAAVLTSHGG
jgi:propanol-preferring alcohol dehydrogenase